MPVVGRVIIENNEISLIEPNYFLFIFYFIFSEPSRAEHIGHELACLRSHPVSPSPPLLPLLMANAGESQQAAHTSPAPVLPPPGEALPYQPPSFPSDAAVVEWEAKVQAWLATLPTRRNVTAAEIDVWIDSHNPPLLPESVQCLPRSHLHARILTLHKLLRGSVAIQVFDLEHKRLDFCMF